MREWTLGKLIEAGRESYERLRDGELAFLEENLPGFGLFVEMKYAVRAVEGWRVNPLGSSMEPFEVKIAPVAVKDDADGVERPVDMAHVRMRGEMLWWRFLPSHLPEAWFRFLHTCQAVYKTNINAKR